MRFLLTFFFLAVLLPGSYSYAKEYTIEIGWTIEQMEDVELAGYRLYDLQHNMICETTDPTASEMTCTVDCTGTEATYILVSYATNGIESDPSDPFTIIFEEIPLEAIINLTAVSLAVDFDATASTGSITQYSWDFNDGSPIDHNATTSHIFSAAGTYTVSLTIQDADGNTDTTSQQITVSESSGGNQPPTAALVINGSAPAGEAPMTVEFDAGGSSDPEGSSLTYSWDFGDGTTATGSEQISHQYTVAGTYRATVTVTDSQGAFDTETSQPIMVSEGSGGGTTPIATITASKTSGPAPLSVTLNGADSTPSAQTETITQYSWDFGDGSTGTGVEVSHTFMNPGNYTVQLTVEDSSGQRADTTIAIDVYEPGTQNNIPTLIQVYKLLLLKN